MKARPDFDYRNAGMLLKKRGRGQPTLTIQAQAFRAAEHMASFVL